MHMQYYNHSTLHYFSFGSQSDLDMYLAISASMSYPNWTSLRDSGSLPAGNKSLLADEETALTK
jgi:hypothetical protein